MRIANLFSASTSGILPNLSWQKKQDNIALRVPVC
ncbi:exopolyphosphatase / guanosine-5'-triphosphate,3'-diphosphate pyrophosphatase [Bartonella sp. JB63]|nr:exopolyphosphatase / guanosine-5'-triphosphate,3'-diphosphate pyrophosphatase [Bartonella sp. JB15]AQX29219.1 exopolyphosphatase / guanosine-5'-triphosphate,3'-diphosphate pyrophosphatase [Bartonella sp. JB63]